MFPGWFWLSISLKAAIKCWRGLQSSGRSTREEFTAKVTLAIGQPQFLVTPAFPQVVVFSRDSDPIMDEGDRVFK